MKILELRFKNLNSLYGEWSIDFSAPDYIGNGIFAITGPTGAGKSTIMDAICLALYGSTPRLGRITASGNEIMSRQTGECYAEVTFESQAGRFRCHWSQHRARKRADGKLAEAKHEIADVISNQILQSQKRDVARVIEEKTGMDYERFTRSILLAQGGFAAFLQAPPDERAPVLEQITGTEIYSEISRRVHERQRDERNTLDLMQSEISGITVLSDEQVAAMTLDLQAMSEAEKKIATQNQTVKTAILWLNGIAGLHEEIAGIDQEQAGISLALDQFKPEREKLRCAQKAADLEGEFSALASLRLQQKNDQAALKLNDEQLPQASLLFKQKQEALQKAEAAVQQAKSNQQAEAPLLKAVRMLDLQISEKLKAVTTNDLERRKLEGNIGENRTSRALALAKRTKAQLDLQKALAYLVANAGDEALIAQLAAITEQIRNLQLSASDVAAKKTALAAGQNLAQTNDKACLAVQIILAERQTAAVAASNGISQLKDDLQAQLGGRLLREYRSECDSLLRERAYLQKIASLEDERKKLADGQPCPLCGSIHHPFAEGNVPEADETEKQISRLSAIIKAADDLETRLKALEAKEKEIAAKASEAEKQLALALSKKESSAAELERQHSELAAAAARFSQIQATVLAGLQPLGITSISTGGEEALLALLNDRLQKWQDHQRQRDDIEKVSSELTSKIERLDAINNTLAAALQEKLAAMEVVQLDCAQLQTERRGLYDTRNPDQEEIRLQRLVEAAETLEKSERTAHDQAREQMAGIMTRITALTEALAGRSPELAALEQSSAANRMKSGFEDEQAFCASRLPVDERHRLIQREQELDQKQADILTRKNDRASRLALELAKNVTADSLEQLTAAQAELEGQLRTAGERIGAIKQQIADNTAARERIQTKQAAIGLQKSEWQRWEKLHALIGSADGKKYRNFAQGLTFELMVAHANRQLSKMTDRYLLISDAAQPLELGVIDNYQAGEIRSTKNLSGGESFIVSLSLALGLSKMASRKVRVDSLFLDEGFGTLDEDALETALETLAGLHQDGKLIGVISHVSALKERISTQITIVPRSGGKSIITGPGIRQIVPDAAAGTATE